jgi:hypothetical protein
MPGFCSLACTSSMDHAQLWRHVPGNLPMCSVLLWRPPASVVFAWLACVLVAKKQGERLPGRIVVTFLHL